VSQTTFYLLYLYANQRNTSFGIKVYDIKLKLVNIFTHKQPINGKFPALRDPQTQTYLILAICSYKSYFSLKYPAKAINVKMRANRDRLYFFPEQTHKSTIHSSFSTHDYLLYKIIPAQSDQRIENI